MQAKVKKWNRERGFGWISAADGADYFLHVSQWTLAGIPEVGSTVEFDIGPGLSGKKPQATNARYNTDVAAQQTAETNTQVTTTVVL
jgi:cold shock protein